MKHYISYMSIDIFEKFLWLLDWGDQSIKEHLRCIRWSYSFLGNPSTGRTRVCWWCIVYGEWWMFITGDDWLWNVHLAHMDFMTMISIWRYDYVYDTTVIWNTNCGTNDVWFYICVYECKCDWVAMVGMWFLEVWASLLKRGVLCGDALKIKDDEKVGKKWKGRGRREERRI